VAEADTSGKGSEGKKGGGIGALLLVMALLTIVAGGIGFLSGNQLRHSLAQPASAMAAPSAPRPPKPDGLQVVALPPVLTALAGESGGWIRFEASVLVDGDKPLPSDQPAKLSEDILAVLRTLTLHQISGASGFQHLREELTDRLKTRTSGRVREITIQSMVIE
jgi:flagellar protein FliL